MNPMVTGALVFAGLFGAGLLGLRIRALLPHHHQSAETKDAVRIGMGLVATMAALVLGLLVASTKGAYDSERSAVMQMAAKIGFLDRVLAAYGPETAQSRQLLHGAVENVIRRMWPDGTAQPARLNPIGAPAWQFVRSIQDLTPRDDMQRALKSQAMQLAVDLGQMRWMLFEQVETSISLTLLIIMLVWLAVIFMSIGLFAPPNATVIAAILLAALSVAGAIFLILELDMPFDGLIQISSTPMRTVLSHLGQ